MNYRKTRVMHRFPAVPSKSIDILVSNTGPLSVGFMLYSCAGCNTLSELLLEERCLYVAL